MNRTAEQLPTAIRTLAARARTHGIPRRGSVTPATARSRTIVRTIVAGLTAAWLTVAVAPPASQAAEPTDALAAVTDRDDLQGSARRQIVLYPNRIEFLHGARSLGSVAFPGRDTSLPQLAEVVGRVDPSGWIRQAGPGRYVLRAALVQAPGTTLTVAAPAVREVRLAGAYLAGFGAHARLQGITLTSWDPGTRAPERQPRRGRPFVFYGRGSTLDVERAELAFLGSGRAKGEAGVTWSLAGGRVTDTVLHHNYEGVTLDRARSVVVRGSTFRSNTHNGLAAAGPSRGLDIGGSKALDNGANGMFVRRKTVGASLHGNHASGNARNGIVLDQHADHAVVERNTVAGNAEDGLVLRAVSDARLVGNTVGGNRVGVRVAVRSNANLLEGNRIRGNRVGVELYDGSHDTRLTGNQIAGSKRVGIVLEAPDTHSRGDRVEGGPVGIEVRAAPTTLQTTAIRGADTGVLVTGRGVAQLTDATIAGADTGVLVDAHGTARLTGATVDATAAAVETRPGGVTRVRDSELQAPVPLHGTTLSGQAAGNRLIEPAASTAWLALAGLTCVVLAIALQIVHRVRNGHEDVRHAGG